MCVLYKLLHLHCIFEAHPFEIERLLSSSEGSVKEAKRSLSEGKVFGQAVGLRIARYGKVRGALGLGGHFGVLAADNRRDGEDSWRFLELIKHSYGEEKTMKSTIKECFVLEKT